MYLTEDTILEKRYRIDGLLAKGGMGAIYRAFDQNLSTPVAIKENFFQTSASVAQFKQEALILARLRHPALPRVIQHFSAHGKQYLVMDFIEGQNLWELVEQRQRSLTEREALDYLIQVCQAVGYLHRQKPPIIHRDIKPQNIKITPQGQAVLVDFGIAKQVTTDQTRTYAGAQGVTPGFSSPEQYSRQGTTPASDLYSLGATLYALLTGQRPLDALSRSTGKTDKLTSLSQVNPRLSPHLVQAITRALAIDPAHRPASVAEWQQELEGITEATVLIKVDPGATLPDVPAAGLVPDPALAAATHWLVDATGVGFPLGSQPQVIGRHSEADIVLDDLSASRAHARIRLEGGRCLVMDSGSANGTTINEARLGPEWYPLNPGDTLKIGSTRFYLTTTKPARLAAPRPTAPPISPVRGHTTRPEPPPRPASTGNRARWGLIVAALLALAAAAAGGFWLLRPGFTGGQPPAAPAVMVDTPTPTVTPVPPTATATVLVAVTPLAPAATHTPAPVVEKKDTIPTVTATRPPATGTPTLAASPTVTLAAVTATAAPAVSGPTAIPLQAVEQVDQLGPREVIDVDFNPKNPQEVIALVKGDGLYRSVSGGDGPWTRFNLDGSGLVALVVDPTRPATLYAPTWNAVLKSTDGGNTWDAKMNGLVANRTVDTLAVDPPDPARLYAGIGETLVVSTDGGESWQSQGYGAGLRVGRLYAIVMDPFMADTLYVAGQAAAIYKSTDGGRNFAAMPYNTGLGAYSLAAHPAQAGVLLAGINKAEAGIIRTQNGWDFESVSTGLIFGGADSAYSALAFALANPAIVYAGSGFESDRDAKGLFKSTDGGQTWSRINKGIPTLAGSGYPRYVKAIAVHPASANIALAATGSGLFKTTDGGASWALR